ncbi:hypothetical protein COEREDRAFT_86767 [Coemansia reversa NRRL 1564]|uniref:Uncharacterized protein n=1 Tax=Coemansia reversa (strain ATCC 12441 / NRRL 1564) TaxID=763665 RepID=A0A2G5BCF2_COERN|nr:hypothetical protein COEREDRAFT_86767 [Coemansia reversa NRRL 1564]|eukprot:PIA16681.1 hypothetical protein COEREDRAFT_86767 [Coemansia reversa NRRL 1564]
MINALYNGSCCQRQASLSLFARRFSKHNRIHNNRCAAAQNRSTFSNTGAPHLNSTQFMKVFGAEAAKIRRDFGYPAKYHAGSFPWLLSAERQRIPMEDLDASILSAVNSVQHGASFGDRIVGASTQFFPLAARRRLAHTLNMRIARAALGTAAMDSVCDGAADVLPRVASLLSSASSGDADAAEELSHIFTRSLLARYMRDLDSLRKDNVLLALEIHSVEDARIHQLRTQTGPEEAFAALDNIGTASSTLSAGLTRQNYRYTSVLGNTHAAPCQSPSTWPGDVAAAMGGQMPVRVRVDVELMVNMRYRLIGRHDESARTIVDDDAMRNVMLTLESSFVATHQGQTSFEWRVADVDYLLSSEQRIENELVEATRVDENKFST